MHVHVVAWEVPESCAGFDWYFTRQDAKEAYELEGENCRICDGWTRLLATIAVPDGLLASEITDAIDARLWESYPPSMFQGA